MNHGFLRYVYEKEEGERHTSQVYGTESFLNYLTLSTPNSHLSGKSEITINNESYFDLILISMINDSGEKITDDHFTL